MKSSTKSPIGATGPILGALLFTGLCGWAATAEPAQAPPLPVPPSPPVAAIPAIAAAPAGAGAEDPSRPPDPPMPPGTSATIERSVRSALRETELALSRAAEAGKSIAIHLANPGRPSVLVLPGGRLHGAESDVMAEDLTVMSRILEKAAGRPDPAARLSYGAFLGPGFLGGHDLSALYLDGFGVLFLTSVDFPLVGPTEPKGVKEAAATDPAWEEARREVQDGRGPRGGRPGWRERFDHDGGVYDAVRIEEFKRRLISTLKHARNIRLLAPEETIAVAVYGPVSREAEAYGGRNESRNALMHDGREDGRPVDSVLTLRVKKSEVDALAAGKSSPEEFARKVEISMR